MYANPFESSNSKRAWISSIVICLCAASIVSPNANDQIIGGQIIGQAGVENANNVAQACQSSATNEYFSP